MFCTPLRRILTKLKLEPHSWCRAQPGRTQHVQAHSGRGAGFLLTPNKMEVPGRRKGSLWKCNICGCTTLLTLLPPLFRRSCAEGTIFECFQFLCSFMCRAEPLVEKRTVGIGVYKQGLWSAAVSPGLAGGFLGIYSQIKPSKGVRGRGLLPSEMQYAHVVLVQGSAGSEGFVALSLEKEWQQ